MIPNKLEGRGCQCQRLVKVVDIDEQIYARLRNNSREKLVGVRKTPRFLLFRSRNLTASRSGDDVVKEMRR